MLFGVGRIALAIRQLKAEQAAIRGEWDDMPIYMTAEQCGNRHKEDTKAIKEQFDRGSREFREIKDIMDKNEGANQERHDRLVQHLLDHQQH